MKGDLYWPGTRIVKSRGNAFDWQGVPSIFTDRSFRAFESGESASQAATRAVQDHEQRTGRSRGTISGLSVKADELLGQEMYLGRSRKVAA